MKVAGKWRYLYRAVDQSGQVIDVPVSPKRDKTAARRFFTGALAGATSPTEVSTDRAPAYPRIAEDLLPGALHSIVKVREHRVEADAGRLNAQLRLIRGSKTVRSLQIVATGHAFIQKLRRGHYEFATEATARDRVAVALTELALAI